MIASVMSAATTGYKVISVVNSGVKIYKTLNNPQLNGWQKTHNVALNTMYMLTQTVALNVDSVNTNIAASVFSACRNVSNKSLDGKATSAEVLKGVFFEIGMLNDSIKILRPLVDNVPYNLLTDEGASLLFFMASDYDNLKDVPDHIKKIWKNKTKIWNWLRGKKIPHYVRTDSRTGQPIFTIPRAEYEQRRRVQELNGIEELREIPEFFSGTDVYSHYGCPITQKYIRFLVVLNGTQEDDHPVFYEKRAIEQWIADHPNERPASWPPGIPYQLSSLVPSKSHQAIINSQFEKDFQEIKGTRYEPDSEEVNEPPRQRQRTENGGERS